MKDNIKGVTIEEYKRMQLKKLRLEKLKRLNDIIR
mgnify:CR=1 FL=1